MRDFLRAGMAGPAALAGLAKCFAEAGDDQGVSSFDTELFEFVKYDQTIPGLSFCALVGLATTTPPPPPCPDCVPFLTLKDIRTRISIRYIQHEGTPP